MSTRYIHRTAVAQHYNSIHSWERLWKVEDVEVPCESSADDCWGNPGRREDKNFPKPLPSNPDAGAKVERFERVVATLLDCSSKVLTMLRASSLNFLSLPFFAAL